MQDWEKWVEEADFFVRDERVDGCYEHGSGSEFPAGKMLGGRFWSKQEFVEGIESKRQEGGK